MRRLAFGLLVGAVALGGCEQFGAKSDVAALVGSHELSAERVATIMAKSGGGPTVQAAEFIANLWLDYSLMARAWAENKIPRDSAGIEEVLWPTMATIKVNMWRDTVRAHSFAVTPAAVDSAYDSDNRIFQHIIVIPAGTTPADTQAARRKITDVLARARAGADFGDLAKQNSADGSKDDQGYLPYGPRGQFVPEFDNVAWSLQPGQLSDVVQSSFGFHVIRRPPLTEARQRVEAGLQSVGAQHADSLYIERLAEAANLEVAGGAAAAMKSAALNPEDARHSSRTLVSLKGGNVTMADFVRWTAMFPLQGKMQIRNANDTLLTGFARELGLRTLLLRQADSAGIKVEGQMMQFARMRYDQAVGQLGSQLGLDVPELSDSSKLAMPDKLKLASEKVETFFEQLLEGRAQMVVMPPELGDYLRAQGGGRVNAAGVSRAVELARVQFSKDSAAASQQGAPGAVREAPGGPPVGGAPAPATPDSGGSN
ncbi:MAG: peptidylprolyl isomerase [Gemmatimonadales bacterium]